MNHFAYLKTIKISNSTDPLHFQNKFTSNIAMHLILTKELEYYLDGGSIGIPTNKGTFVIDRRPHSKTYNQLYLGYPEPIPDTDETTAQIVTDPVTKEALIKTLAHSWYKLNSLTDEALQILRQTIPAP